MGIFNFKQFSVDDTGCSLKTGTDSVLLGSWVPLPKEGTFLDVGCGSAVLTLMLAQRAKNHIIGIEIEKRAVEQSNINRKSTPWAKRITIIHDDFVKYFSTTTQQFSLVIANPPWFKKDLPSPDEGRKLARQGTTLHFDSLILGAWQVLTPGGTFAVIIPFNSCTEFHQKAVSEGFMLENRAEVRNKEKAPVKRILLLYRKSPPDKITISTIILKNEDNTRHPSYKKLTEDFYL